MSIAKPTRRRFLTLTAATIAATGVVGCTQLDESPLLKANHLVDSSVQTIERFQTLEGLQRFREFLPTAEAVAIFPQVIKAGFFWGAEAGNGLIMARTNDGGWSAPAFYTLGAGSFGLQIGAQDTEILLIIRSRDALNAILNDQAKIGADAGITAGTFGIGAEASTTTSLGVDILAFSNSRVGGFLGASVEGAVIARRQDINEGVYGQGVVPQQIISDPGIRLARADRLKAVLANN